MKTNVYEMLLYESLDVNAEGSSVGSSGFQKFLVSILAIFALLKNPLSCTGTILR